MLDVHKSQEFKETWIQVRKYIMDQKYLKALSLSEQITTLSSPPALIEDHIQILLKLNRLPQAEYFLKSMIDNPASRSQATLLLGHFYFKTEKWEQANHYYHKYLAIEPKSIHATYNLSLVQSHLGNFDSACTFFEKCLSLSSTLPPSFYRNFGMALLYTQRVKEAQQYLLQALKFCDPCPEISFHLGLTYHMSGELEEALKIYEQALSIDSTHAPSLHNFATTAMSLSKHEQAEEALTKLHALHPEDVIVKTLYDALSQAELTSHNEAFIQTLFDQYAFNYDHHLTQVLKYNPFQRAREILNEFGKLENFQCGVTYDLGCGSGLAAPYFIDLSYKLIGVDLSAGMLIQAEKKQAYDTLVQKDILDYVRQMTLNPKLVLGFEVTNYLGKRTEVLIKMLSEKILPGGFLLLTFESQESSKEDCFLNKQVRFSFSQEYIEEIMSIGKLKLLHLEKIALRVHEQSHIQGFIALSQALN